MDPRLLESLLSGNTAAFQSLLAQDPLILDRIALTSVENPLHISALAGKTEIAREIVRLKPAFVTELNEDGFSPLHIASANGQVELVRVMLEVGFEACLVKGKDGRIPLHFAAIKGRVDVVKELVCSCPHSVKEVSVFGETALHLAVKSNQFEVVRDLVEEIKKLELMEIVNWKDRDGNTILHIASFKKQHEVVGLLIGREAIAYGVEVNPINSNGFTPKDVLDFVLQNGGERSDILMLELFQQAGAMSARELAATPASNLQVLELQKTEKNLTTFSTSCSWTIWRELTKEIEESSVDTQNALMVVAVLIATVTYQAILSPPSGFVSTDTRRSPTTSLPNTSQRRHILPGEAAMATDPEVFAVFTVFNAMGFFASLAMISLLTRGFPLRAGLRLAIMSMAATYVITAVYTAPTAMKTVNIIVGLVGLLVLTEFARFTIWILKKLGVFPPRRMRSFPDANQSRV